MAIAINTIAHLFLFIDIISSQKSNDPVVFVFFIGIIGMFIANVILLITLYKLHSVYSGKGVPIRFTRDSRNKIRTYKKLFIVNVLTIFIMAFFYFTAYKIDLSIEDARVYYLIKNNFDKTGQYYVPFYNFTFDPEGTTMEKSIEILMLLFKTVLGLGVVGVTSIMVYYSYGLSKLKTSRDQLYIPEERDETVPKTIPHKGSYSSFSLSNMFQNLNINYLLHSTTIL